MKYFFLLFFVFSFAQAGVRTVGKGGGYAEMQAILVNEQMRGWTEHCLKYSSCGLSASESALLESVLSSAFVIEMRPDCIEPFVFVQTSSSAALSSCLLYQPGQSIAKDFSDIASWVLTARLMSIQGINLLEAREISQKVFLNYQQSEQYLGVTLTQSFAILHFLQISHEQKTYNIFSIEGKSSAMNITSLVQDALVCDSGVAHLQSVEFLGSQEMAPFKAYTESEVVWSCEGKSTYRAILQLSFSMSQSEIVRDSILLKLVRKTEI